MEELVELIRNGSEPAATPGINVQGNHNLVVTGSLKFESSQRPERGRPPGAGRKSWRAEMEGGIWDRAWNLNMMGDQVLALATAELRRQIESLATLSQHELDVLDETIARMRRPAMD